MFSEKVFGNFINILTTELYTCGCIELNHEFLRKVGYCDLPMAEVPELVSMIGAADKGFHVFVNEEGDSPRYFVYKKVLPGKSLCGDCVEKGRGCADGPIGPYNQMPGNRYYIMRCRQCTYDACMCKVPRSRKLY
jgi:hypothetical protein